MKIDKYKLSIEILDYFGKQSRPILRSNVIGLDYQEGSFGLFHKRSLSNEERSALDLTLSDLQKRGMIQPAYRELINRGEDLQITEKGIRAFEKKVLDNLDEILFGIDPQSKLINMRYGAYDAVLNRQADWQRQAATSLVELIDHTLRTISPDDGIRAKTWFVADPSSKTGITRKHRVRYYLEVCNGNRSESTEQIVNKSWELIEASRAKLENIKHTSDDKEEIEQLISLVEDTLIYMLKNKE